MKKNVAVVVLGEAGTGKSTIMYLLEKVLRENGFIVEIDLSGNYDYKNDSDFHIKMKANEKERFDVVKDNVKITLKEMQMANGSTKVSDDETKTDHNN